MPVIVGIDLSLTSTGLCRVDNGVIRCSTFTTKPVKGDNSFLGKSARIMTIAGWVKQGVNGADMVVLEGPSFGSHGTAVHTLAWLWGRVFDVCTAEYGIETVVVSPHQRAKYVTGKGNAAKDAVLATVVRRWPNVDVNGNDQADALVLAAIGARMLGCPVDTVPKANYEFISRVAA